MGQVKNFLIQCAARGIYPLMQEEKPDWLAEVIESETTDYEGKPFSSWGLSLADAIEWHNTFANSKQRQEVRDFFKDFEIFMADSIERCDQCGRIGFSCQFWNLVSGKTCSECFERGNY